MRSTLLAVFSLSITLFLTGCYTNQYLNFGNGTTGKITVKDMQTGEEVHIAPKKFRKIGHGEADLLVTTAEKHRYVFSGIKVPDIAMDSKYYDPKAPALGIIPRNEFDINVLLETNMQVYVLLPGKKAINPNIPQPTGYPKKGRELSE